MPANYCACVEVTPEDLFKAYSANYGDYNRAQAMYTGQPFVFKKIRVIKEMIVDANTFVTNSLQFNAQEPGAVAKLKIGDVTNCGMPSGFPGLIIFNDCFFIPSGSLAIPASGGAAFTPMY